MEVNTSDFNGASFKKRNMDLEACDMTEANIFIYWMAQIISERLSSVSSGQAHQADLNLQIEERFTVG